MMITFSVLYLVFYTLIFLTLLSISFFVVPFFLLSKFPLSVYFNIIGKYTQYKLFVAFIFLFLTGLPPFALFLVKFNILEYTLYNNHITIIVFLFLGFLLNMFFYAQTFNHKNDKGNVYLILTGVVFQNSKYTTSLTKKYSYVHYWVFLGAINTFFFLLLSPLFYTDFFLIMNL